MVVWIYLFRERIFWEVWRTGNDISVLVVVKAEEIDGIQN